MITEEEEPELKVMGVQETSKRIESRIDKLLDRENINLFSIDTPLFLKLDFEIPTVTWLTQHITEGRKLLVKIWKILGLKKTSKFI